MFKSGWLLLISLFLVTSCAQNNLQVLNKKINQHKVQTNAYWQFETNANLEEKIVTKLPIEVDDFLSLWREKYNLDTARNLKPSKLKSKNFSFIFRYAVINLPQELKVKLNRKIKKIFLVKNLGVSSLIFRLKDKNEDYTGKFIVFYDQDVLNQGINDWFSWREMTAFKESSDLKISAYLDHENSTVATIQYALLQSLGTFSTWDPRFFPNSKTKLTNIDNFPFLRTSWIIKDNILRPKFDDFSKTMNFIKYYTLNEPLHPIDKAMEFYKELEKTNYPNLYASTSIAKDLIESMASYLHVTLLKRPYQIEFLKNKKTSETFSSCWERPRCFKKKKSIEKIYSQF